MTLQSYSKGTITVEQGSDTIVLAGDDAAWLQSWCVPGNQVDIAGEAQSNHMIEWIDQQTVKLALPVARADASGLVYSILMTAPAFGTNRVGALTAVERIRLMTENEVISQLLAIATGGLMTPALNDRLSLWDASDANNAKPGTLGAALKAGTSVLAKSANYAVGADDYGALIAMSAGTGARTVTLPAAATAGAGFVIGVKKTDSSNTVTIAAASGETIDGAASLALTVQYATVVLRCDGTSWHVVVLENTSAFARTLLDDADAAALWATIGATAPADKAFRRGNILGTVSQSGGVPTGAIIERGSNANGEYVRFADGTQICRLDAIVTLAGGQSADQRYTFPAAFSGNPQVYTSISDIRSSFIGIDRFAIGVFGESLPSPTGGRVRMYTNGSAVSFTNTGQTISISIRAEGRWF